jgi:uncharacterized glyoxalase superfamily protein PhnB
MAKPPRGWRTITPRLVVTDVAKEVRFLKRAFGATEVPSQGPSVLQIGDSRLMVSEVDPRPVTESLLYLYVDDVDATYRRARKAGARSVERPQQTPYGDRRAMVEDPSGTVWQIATFNK